MRAPRVARALVRLAVPASRADDVLGDLEEVHGRRVTERGRYVAALLTTLEAADIALSLILPRVRARWGHGGSGGAAVEPGTRIRSARSRRPQVSWLDFKLGLRMLVKYPGMTIVGGLAIAFAVTLGVTSFEVVSDYLSPRIALPQADRLVLLGTWDPVRGRGDGRLLHDYEVWKQELTSVSELGAYASSRRSILGRGGGRSLVAADITASAMRMARTPPALGRLLHDADEVAGAPDVVVVGHGVWQNALAGDPDVIGSEIRIGARTATVVGVMPEGFLWPVRHDIWQPMRYAASNYEFGAGPGINVTARVAPGATLEDVRAELEVVHARLAAAHPASHGHLEPIVRKYGHNELPVVGVSQLAFLVVNALFFVMLVLLVCGNVALLLFARTSARRNEIVVRNALGASRRRIVWQLFIEAMVLTTVAGIAGIGAAKLVIEWGNAMLTAFDAGGFMGFWFDDGVSPRTMLAAIGLALLAGVVCGVLPALRATEGGLGSGLQRAAAGSGRDFGRLWGGLIIAQITVTVLFAPLMVYLGAAAYRLETWDHGVGPASLVYAGVEQYVSSPDLLAELAETGYPGSEAERRYAAAMPELEDRLAEELETELVTVATAVPGQYHPWRYVQVDGPAAPPRDFVRGWRIATASVDDDYFDVLGVPIVSGRGFDARDRDGGQPVAIANQLFVDRVLEGRNPIGRRFAFVERGGGDPPRPDSLGPWVEIVGVIPQIATNSDPEVPESPGVYLPLQKAERWMQLVARTDVGAGTLAPTLRQMAVDVDPSLVVRVVRPLEESTYESKVIYQAWFVVVLIAGGIGMLLATAGIYAILSFTVARRTREIGVRVALGAARFRIVRTVFARAFRQIATGIVLGALLFTLVLSLAGRGPQGLLSVPTPRDLMWIGALVLGMTSVCGLACIVPTRRALAIEPTEALKAEG